MRKRNLGPIILLALLAAAGVAALTLGHSGWLHADRLRAEVTALGAWAPVGFIVLNVAFNLLTLPAAAMTLLAGYLFGPVWGTVFNLVGATTGASAAFLIARGLGRDAVEAKLGGRLRELDANLANRGFPYLLVLRLLPIMPFNWVSYGAGVTGVSFRSFVAATALGIFPLVALYAFFGSAAAAALAK